MKSDSFGKIPFLVSKTGLGTAQLSNVSGKNNKVKNVSLDAANNILFGAVDLGMNFFDTGCNYGDAELLLGDLKRQVEEDIFIATKIGLDENGIRDFSLKVLRDQFNCSMNKLRVCRIDMLQLNKPSLSDLKDGKLYDFLDELKERDLIGFRGLVVGDILTGYESIASGRVDSIQVLFNLLCQETGDLIDYAKKNEIAVIVRSPLNSGLLSGTYSINTSFDEGDERSNYFFGKEFEERLREIHDIQQILGVDDNDLLEYSMHFIISNPGVSVVIPGASNLKQMQRYAKCNANFKQFSEDYLKKVSIICSNRIKRRT